MNWNGRSGGTVVVETVSQVIRRNVAVAETSGGFAMLLDTLEDVGASAVARVVRAEDRLGPAATADTGLTLTAWRELGKVRATALTLDAMAGGDPAAHRVLDGVIQLTANPGQLPLSDVLSARLIAAQALRDLASEALQSRRVTALPY